MDIYNRPERHTAKVLNRDSYALAAGPEYAAVAFAMVPEIPSPFCPKYLKLTVDNPV